MVSSSIQIGSEASFKWNIRVAALFIFGLILAVFNTYLKDSMLLGYIVGVVAGMYMVILGLSSKPTMSLVLDPDDDAPGSCPNCAGSVWLAAEGEYTCPNCGQRWDDEIGKTQNMLMASWKRNQYVWKRKDVHG
jgi:hypothetical protein